MPPAVAANAVHEPLNLALGVVFVFVAQETKKASEPGGYPSPRESEAHFSMWDQPGLLVEGFDTPPSVMMGHALPYFRSGSRVIGNRRYKSVPGGKGRQAWRALGARAYKRYRIYEKPLY
jgi:hypothetical protein